MVRFCVLLVLFFLNTVELSASYAKSFQGDLMELGLKVQELDKKNNELFIIQKSLEEEIQEKNEDIEQKDHLLQQATITIQEKEQSLTALQEVLSVLKSEKHRADQECQKKESIVQDLQRKLDSVAQENSLLVNTELSLRRTIEEKSRAVERLESHLTAIQEKIDEKNIEMRLLRLKAEDNDETIQREKSYFEQEQLKLQNIRVSLENDLRHLKEKLIAETEKTNASSKEKEEICKKIKLYQLKNNQNRLDIDKKNIQINKLNDQIALLESEVVSLKTYLERCRAQSRDISEAMGWDLMTPNSLLTKIVTRIHHVDEKSREHIAHTSKKLNQLLNKTPKSHKRMQAVLRADPKAFAVHNDMQQAMSPSRYAFLDLSNGPDSFMVNQVRQSPFPNIENISYSQQKKTEIQELSFVFDPVETDDDTFFVESDFRNCRTRNENLMSNVTQKVEAPSFQGTPSQQDLSFLSSDHLTGGTQESLKESFCIDANHAEKSVITGRSTKLCLEHVSSNTTEWVYVGVQPQYQETQPISFWSFFVTTTGYFVSKLQTVLGAIEWFPKNQGLFWGQKKRSKELDDFLTLEKSKSNNATVKTTHVKQGKTMFYPVVVFRRPSNPSLALLWQVTQDFLRMVKNSMPLRSKEQDEEPFVRLNMGSSHQKEDDDYLIL